MTSIFRLFANAGILAILAVLLLGSGCRTANPDDESTSLPDRPNVLMIMVDDLRPQLNTYGRSQMDTPEMDQFAASGIQFNRAFCSVPTCGASRASLMTGVRPSMDRFRSYDTFAQQDAPGVPAMNDHFQSHGYRTVSLGKVFHHAGDHRSGWDRLWRPDLSNRTYVTRANIELDQKNPGRGRPYERADEPVRKYPDGQLAEKTIAELKRLGNQDRPWFLATGFYKPHLPFAAPDRFWAKYDGTDVHLPPNYERPKNVPDAAMHNFGELRSYHGVPDEGPVSDEMARKLIHGYYACVSFVDAMVGRVLDALENEGLREDTIVVLWADHGWQLGEHGLWAKHSVFETSMHIPLIVSAPGFPEGEQTDALTGSIDLFPTLTDLTGLPTPDPVDGRSFRSVLRSPDRSFKEAVYGRYGNGESIRTPRYRFSVFKGGQDMLFDHQVDPGETVSIANRKDTGSLRDRLRQQLIDRMGQTGRFENRN